MAISENLQNIKEQVLEAFDRITNGREKAKKDFAMDNNDILLDKNVWVFLQQILNDLKGVAKNTRKAFLTQELKNALENNENISKDDIFKKIIDEINKNSDLSKDFKDGLSSAFSKENQQNEFLKLFNYKKQNGYGSFNDIEDVVNANSFNSGTKDTIKQIANKVIKKKINWNVMKIVIALIFFSLSLFAYSNKEIANAIKRQAMVNGIDQRLIYTIAKIESGFKPLTISFTSYKDKFYFEKAKTKIAKYRDKYIISITADKDTLVKISYYLIEKGYLVDVGLMQLNSQNFNKTELIKAFELDYNISKSLKVLVDCQKKFKHLKETIECYNKGFRKNVNYDYYARFKNSFNRDFGVRQ